MQTATEAAGSGGSTDELFLHRRTIARAPVLGREAQTELSRRLCRERDAFVAAALEAPEVVEALLARWRGLREAGRSTGVLSVHHVEGTDRDLSGEIDRALERVEHLLKRCAPRKERAAAVARRRVAGALRDAELAVEAIVRAFRDSDRAETSAQRRAAAAAYAAYAATRDTLVRHNLRLVIRFARPFRSLPVPLSDLVQEGTIGLMRAVEKFDPERGLSFSTYAAWWIHQALIRTVQREGRAVRLPSTVHEQEIRYRRTEQALRAATSEAPSRDEVGRAMGLSTEQVERLAAFSAPISSLDAPLPGREFATLEDALPDESCEDPAIARDRRVLASSLPAMLAPLGERERAVLTARFGLDGSEAESLTELGARLGLSRERVRQIEVRALARIRKGAIARGLVTWRAEAISPR